MQIPEKYLSAEHRHEKQCEFTAVLGEFESLICRFQSWQHSLEDLRCWENGYVTRSGGKHDQVDSVTCAGIRKQTNMKVAKVAQQLFKRPKV